MHDNGKQIVLLNEIKTVEEFYKFWGVEADIRDIAGLYPNSYSMAFFACCRELKQSAKHTHGLAIGDAKALIEKQFNEMPEGSEKDAIALRKKEADEIFDQRVKN